MSGAPRSNSFHFVPARDVPRSPGQACPLVSDRAGREVSSRTRARWLRLKDRMRLFETSTTDFGDAEIAHLVDELGQLYLDVSRKDRVDDFARDLRPLRLKAECARCPASDSCARAYEPDADRDFAAEEEIVRECLKALRGTVVDVGPGHAPYAACLQQPALSGALRYVGVEPDSAAAQRLRQSRSWAEVISDLEQIPEVVDHVLLLRSFNHLAEPAGVLRALLSRLRPGGTLLLVDNVAFGVIRSAQQARRAERSTAEFEHFRNACAQDAEQLLRGAPVELTARREVGPGSANQWLLQYRKLG